MRFLLYVLFGIGVLFVVFVLWVLHELLRKNWGVQVNYASYESARDAALEHASILRAFEQRWPRWSLCRLIWHIETWVCPKVALKSFCDECGVYHFNAFVETMPDISLRLMYWTMSNKRRDMRSDMFGLIPIDVDKFTEK